MADAPTPTRRRRPLVYSALPEGQGPVATPIRAASGRKPRRGRVWMPAHPAVVVVAGVVLAPVKVATPRPRRGRGGGRARIAMPPLPGGIGYHVYANTGAGDPINYAAIVATVLPPALAYATAPLSHPGTWSFGLRAFDLVTGFEEANLEAAVTIILDANGVDITDRPAPPMVVGAFATANASIRVQWAYAPTTGPAAPTGFHVYIGPAAGPMAPAGPVARPGSLAGSGSIWMAGGVSCPARRSRRASGAATWRAGQGGSPDYAVPAATVGYRSAIAGSFVANLTGLANGVTYAIGVRAYNATAEEPNTAVVLATATSTGPAAVASLAAAAVS